MPATGIWGGIHPLYADSIFRTAYAIGFNCVKEVSVAVFFTCQSFDPSSSLLTDGFDLFHFYCSSGEYTVLFPRDLRYRELARICVAGS